MTASKKPVDGGLKFNQLGVSAKDQNLIEKNQITREEVLAAYAVPPSIAGLLDFANYSNMEVQERLFYQRGIQPMLRLMEQALGQNPIMSDNGRYHFEFDTSDVGVLQQNKQDIANLGDTLINSSQWTPNEVREQLWELPPLDGGAALKPVAPPIGLGSPLTFQLGSGPNEHSEVQAEVKQLPEFHEVERPETPHFTEMERERMAKQFEEDLERADGDIQRTSNIHFEEQENLALDNLRRIARESGSNTLEAEQIDLVLAGFAALTQKYNEDLGPEMGEIMARFGTREANRLDAAVRKAGGPIITKQLETVVQTVILNKDIFPLFSDAEGWTQENRFKTESLTETNDSWRFTQLDVDFIEEGSFRTIMLAEGVTAVIGRLKAEVEELSYKAKDLYRITKQDEQITFDFSDPRVAEYIQRRSGAVALEVDTLTEEELRQVLAQSVREGKSIAEIADDIEGFFTTQAAVRATRIARTETAVAANRSIMITYDQNSDVVDGKVWITARDSNVRDDHRSLDGTFRSLDELWVLGGAGAPHPGAFGIASQDINCRCTIRAEVRV
jgi:SPP1 gp7 family putative phage head morphogenesis protein